MTQKEILRVLLDESFDKGTMIRRIGVVRQYLEGEYFTPTKRPIADWIKTAGIDESDSTFLTCLPEDFWKGFSRETIYTLLEGVRHDVAILPTITLYIPYAPDNEEKKKIGMWLRSNIHPDILMDFHKDATVVGGCAVAAEGMWRDYSFRYFIRKKHDAIIASVNSFMDDIPKEVHAV